MERRQPDVAAIRKMVEDVLPPEGDFCIQSITNEKTHARHSYTRDPQKIVDFCVRWSLPGRATFFCVSSVKDRSHKKVDAVLTQAINLDLDLKEIAVGRDEALELLLALERPPTRIHFSGNGIHAYWILDAPARPGDATEALQKKLARALGGDPSPTHCVAMMRMPGTYNTKSADWRPVEVACDSGRRYSFEELDEWDVPATILRRSGREEDAYAQLGEEIGRKAPTNVTEMLQAMEYLGHGRGGNVHHTYTVVVGSLVTQGKSEEYTVKKIMRAVKKLDLKGETWDWDREEATIRRMYNDFAESNARQEREREEAFASLASARLKRATEETIEESEDGDDEPPELSTGDLYYLTPRNSFYFVLSGDLWSTPALENKLGKGAAKWIKKNQPVETLTWSPSEPRLIKDKVVNEGGWARRRNTNTLNLYRAEEKLKGSASKAGPWVDLIHEVFPEEAEEIIDFFACGIQRPGVKINHALMLIGSQGIGKDTIIEPVKQAAGIWNFGEVSPQNLFDSFNGYVKNIFLRISEAHDLGDIKRFSLYERMKTLLVSPPDFLRCNEKHLREHYVYNCVKVIITSNHALNSIYLPPDDRRYFVALSRKEAADFPEGFWTDLWQWFRSGGFGHAAAFLRERDLAKYDPKAPPRKTEAFLQIVSSNIAPQHEELSSVLEDLGWPKVVTLKQIYDKADLTLQEWMDDSKNKTSIGYRLGDAGYTKVLNRDRKDNRHMIGGAPTVVYGRVELSVREREEALRDLAPEHPDGESNVTQLKRR